MALAHKKGAMAGPENADAVTLEKAADTSLAISPGDAQPIGDFAECQRAFWRHGHPSTLQAKFAHSRTATPRTIYYLLCL